MANAPIDVEGTEPVSSSAAAAAAKDTARSRAGGRTQADEAAVSRLLVLYRGVALGGVSGIAFATLVAVMFRFLDGDWSSLGQAAWVALVFVVLWGMWMGREANVRRMLSKRR